MARCAQSAAAEKKEFAHLRDKIKRSRMITTMMTHSLQARAKDVLPDQKTAILYARMSIGETGLMGSDVLSERFQPMRSFCLSLSMNSIDGTERIFALLFDGAEIFMPMQETFFALRFAMLRDRFGASRRIINDPNRKRIRYATRQR